MTYGYGWLRPYNLIEYTQNRRLYGYAPALKWPKKSWKKYILWTFVREGGGRLSGPTHDSWLSLRNKDMPMPMTWDWSVQLPPMSPKKSCPCPNPGNRTCPRTPGTFFLTEIRCEHPSWSTPSSICIVTFCCHNQHYYPLRHQLYHEIWWWHEKSSILLQKHQGIETDFRRCFCHPITSIIHTQTCTCCTGVSALSQSPSLFLSFHIKLSIMVAYSGRSGKGVGDVGALVMGVICGDTYYYDRILVT